MTHHENLKIIAFIGADPIDVPTVIDHLAEKSFPKVTSQDMISQIAHLADAGQHRIITGELSDFTLYEELRHDFPGQFSLVGIAPKEDILLYEKDQAAEPENWRKLQETHHTALLPLAHHYVETGNDLTKRVDALLEKLDF